MSDVGTRKTDATIEWLQRSWYIFPENDLLYEKIHARNRIEEIEFLPGFPCHRTSIAELVTRLDILAQKGLVWEDFKNGSLRYGLNDSLFSIYHPGFCPGRDDDSSKATAPFDPRHHALRIDRIY